MKKIINYIGVVLGVVALTACGESYLNQLPGDAIPTDKAITSYDEAKTALNGVYDGLQDYRYYGANMYVSGDVRGDYMQAYSSASRTAGFYEMVYGNQTTIAIWEYPYKLIRRANNVILAIEEGKADEGGSAETINVLKGQALTLRALAHFDMVRVYGKPYQLDNGASLGVPLELKPSDPESQPARSTVAQIYDQVILDLKNAVTLLETSTAKTSSNGFVNVWVAKSLLARVYLYHGDNGLALALAKDVIENSPYVLLTNAGYAAAWADGGNNTEMMFQVVNTSNDSPDRESLSYLMNETGYADMIISKKLVDIMAANPNDVRNGVMIKSAKVDVNVPKFGTAKVWLNKFPGVGGDPRINSTPIIRLSEVYLTAAEAAFKTGPTGMADASFYLNEIAKRNPDLGTVTPTLQSIMDQRGIELVGEGHRFYDLMRNNLASDRSSRWTYTLQPESVNFINTYFRILLPIPQVELDANENLKGQQNDGYGS